MATVEELERQLAETQRQLQDLTLRTTPADQRGAMQQRIELDRIRSENEAERARLNAAALKLRSRELAAETGFSSDEFDKFSDIPAMQQRALELVGERINDPVLLRRWADHLERIPGAPAPAAPAATPAAPQLGSDGRPLVAASPTGTPVAGQVVLAPGGVPVPVGAGQQVATSPGGQPGAPGAQVPPAGAGGASGGTQATGPDPITQVTEQFRGKGAASIAAWLEQGVHGQAQDEVIIGERPTLSPPAPSVTPQAAPVPAAAGAPV